MTDETKRELARYDQQITWLLNNDGTSAWLKSALEGGAACDPVSIVNDIEILCQLLKRRSAAQVRSAISWSAERQDDEVEPPMV